MCEPVGKHADEGLRAGDAHGIAVPITGARHVNAALPHHGLGQVKLRVDAVAGIDLLRLRVGHVQTGMAPHGEHELACEVGHQCIQHP